MLPSVNSFIYNPSKLNCEPTQHSRCIDSPRDGRSGYRIPMGEIFRTLPNWPWGPLGLLYKWYRFFFPRVKQEYSYTTILPVCLHGRLYFFTLTKLNLNLISTASLLKLHRDDKTYLSQQLFSAFMH